MQAKSPRKFFLTFLLCGSAGILLAQDVPDEAFLMYLSDYEQVGDEWVDPAEFAQQLEQMMAETGKRKTTGEKPAEVSNEKRS